jgi:protocatechuate 3,4-dioxygenase beta subunit
MDFASRRNQVRAAFVLAALLTGVVCGVSLARHRIRGQRAAARPASDGIAALATIDGQVVTAAGAPLGGATVVLSFDSDAGDRTPPRVPVATVRARPDGSFHIARVPAGRYRLRAHAPEHADGHLRVQVHPGQTLIAPVRLAPAETVKGQVVDRGGQPIPGARVLVWSLANPLDSSEVARESISDDAGTFVLGGLTRGPHRLIAEAPGFGSVEKAPVEIPGPAPVLRMETDGHTITGVVTAGGAPAGGARVVIGGENLAPTRTTITRGDGTFLISGLGAGSYVLRASRGLEASHPSGEVVLDRSGDRPPVVRLPLAPGWIISGRVVDDEGRLLPAAEVRVEALPGDDPLPEMVHPGADGSWRAGPLPAGEYRLTPRQPGFVARRPVQVMLGPVGNLPGDRSQVLELVRGAQIVGQVVDSKGTPVGGASVRCLIPDREDLAVVADRLPLAAEAAALPSGSGHTVGRTRTTTSDAGGRFELADMLPGRVFVEVDRPGNVATRSGELRLAPGQRLDLGRIGMREGVRVTGQVIDEGGAPVEGARVVVGAAAGAGARGVVALTDGAGRFATAVVDGAHELRVSATGMQGETRTIHVVAAAPSPPEILVRLVRADAALDGSVRDGLGRPLARARVTAWPAPVQADASDPSDRGAPLASTTTDAGGHFRLARLPRGSIAVEIKHGDYPVVSQNVAVSGATPAAVTIDVPVPGGIEGEVREKVTGAVVSSYRIEARGPDGRTAGATRKNGSGFLLARLVPGRWTLTVRAPGYGAVERTVDVPTAAALGQASVRDVRVELSAVN